MQLLIDNTRVANNQMIKKLIESSSWPNSSDPLPYQQHQYWWWAWQPLAHTNYTKMKTKVATGDFLTFQQVYNVLAISSNNQPKHNPSIAIISLPLLTILLQETPNSYEMRGNALQSKITTTIATIYVPPKYIMEWLMVVRPIIQTGFPAFQLQNCSMACKQKQR